jgi:hypothetical protein
MMDDADEEDTGLGLLHDTLPGRKRKPRPIGSRERLFAEHQPPRSVVVFLLTFLILVKDSFLCVVDALA